MASNQQINFKDIDYKGIKESLTEFLQSSDEFKDANFEGSFLSHLVNMFAYTGAIMGNYANSSANEQYISNCNLYETGNMLARLVGYKPHGFVASKTSVVIEPDFDSMGIEDNISSYEGWTAIISENVQFASNTSNERNKSLVFTNTSDALINIKDPASSSDENVNKVSLELIQGVPLSIEYVSDGEDLQSFEIPNPYIDWKEVKVYVMNDGNEEERWENAVTWFHNGPNDKIFVPFINEKGLLEILFAEGSFGLVPPSGKKIRIEYVATSGSDGKISAGTISNVTDSIYFVNPNNQLDTIEGKFTVVQASESTDGSNIETLDRIKKFAPLYYGIQNRLVTEEDYSTFILGEYPYITDVNVFNHDGAIDAELVNNPCYNEFTNSRFDSYNEISVVGSSDDVKVPTDWSNDGFYEYYTVESGDTILVPESLNVSDVLNFGTSSALYVDTTRTCDDDQSALIQQRVDVEASSDECCNIVHFEVEVFNPNKDDASGSYPSVDGNDIALYINGESCNVRFDKFVYNSNGYNSESCCCNREGDVDGWYVIKGIYILDNTTIDAETEIASILCTILVKENRNLLIGECNVYIDNSRDSNDVFIVPVPENGGYLSIETKDTILDAIDKIDMITVRNHIIAPIYQTFDVKVIFKKDETSILTLDDVTNSIRSEINNTFLPINRSLGDRLNTNDIADTISDIPGVARVRITLIPRSSEMEERVNELGDYELLESEFPVLGSIITQ